MMACGGFGTPRNRSAVRKWHGSGGMIARRRLVWFSCPFLGVLQGGCGAHANPVLRLPEPPAALYLIGRVISDSGRPISSLLQFSALSRRGVIDTTIWTRVAPLGQFHFSNLLPGSYELFSRSLGYHTRRDTFALSARPGLEVVLTLVSAPRCLDWCPPDSLLVQAARAQQRRWQCDREHSSIDMARTRWADVLVDARLRLFLRHQLDAHEIARQPSTGW